MLSSRHLPHPSLTYRCCGLLLPRAAAVLSLGRYLLVIREVVTVHRKFKVEAVWFVCALNSVVLIDFCIAMDPLLGPS
jgi:hypothetical protein